MIDPDGLVYLNRMPSRNYCHSGTMKLQSVDVPFPRNLLCWKRSLVVYVGNWLYPINCTIGGSGCPVLLFSCFSHRFFRRVV